LHQAKFRDFVEHDFFDPPLEKSRSQFASLHGSIFIAHGEPIRVSFGGDEGMVQ